MHFLVGFVAGWLIALVCAVVIISRFTSDAEAYKEECENERKRLNVPDDL